MVSPNEQVDLQRDRFEFSNNWFDLVSQEWKQHAVPLCKNKDGSPKRMRILEIGSFEGASATWILDNLMDHPASTLTAVDTFGGGMEHQDPNNALATLHGNGSSEVVPDYSLSTLEARFRSNVSKCKNAKKLRMIKALSSTALLQLRLDEAKFDLVYIDGSHVAFDVLTDAVLSWTMLEAGGALVFDDSRWKGYNEDCYNPRVAVMSFLQCVKQEAKWMETESQMWVTKVPCYITPTHNKDPSLYYWDAGYLLYTSFP